MTSSKRNDKSWELYRKLYNRLLEAVREMTPWQAMTVGMRFERWQAKQNWH